MQLVAYERGIVVISNFSILLPQQSGKEMPKASIGRLIASSLAVICGFTLTYMLIDQYSFIAAGKSFDWSVNTIGNQMLGTGDNGYALPFEVVSILLLAAMIGCIVIALKAPTDSSKAGEQERTKPGF